MDENKAWGKSPAWGLSLSTELNISLAVLGRIIYSAGSAPSVVRNSFEKEEGSGMLQPLLRLPPPAM